jgi:hypothetical protein
MISCAVAPRSARRGVDDQLQVRVHGNVQIHRAAVLVLGLPVANAQRVALRALITWRQLKRHSIWNYAAARWH